MRRNLTFVTALTVGLVGALLAPVARSDEPAPVPVPVVTGPVGDAGLRGHHWNQSVVPLEGAEGAVGDYREDEFFFFGHARALTTDAQSTPEYGSRMVVRRPVDSGVFNGTVIVEWVNVTAQQDFDQHWPPAYQHLMRNGAAFVGVSAQEVGVRHLKNWDPVRYEALTHPGDDYSFDIFAQAIAAVRGPVSGSVDPMGGLDVQRVIASGHSQSGGRMRTFVNRVQDDTGVVDGFFITGQGNPTLELDEGYVLDVPVIIYMSDAEMSATKPSESPWLRVWHVAGTAHNGTWYAHYLADEIARDNGAGQPGFVFDEARSGDYGQQLSPFTAPPGVIPPEAGCPNPNGAMMPDRYAISAALHHLDLWAGDPDHAAEVPATTLAEFDEAGTLVRDQFGNVVGGLRLPPIDVPVATYVACGIVLSGTYVFDPGTLQDLYPSRDDYVTQMQDATDAAVDAGVLLPEDAIDLMARAQQAFAGQLDW